MKLLIKDLILAAGVAVARDLKKSLGYETRHVLSNADALAQLSFEKDTIGIIIFFLEADPAEGLSFIHDCREFCEFAEIRCPKFVVLTPGKIDYGYLGRFKAVGAKPIVCGFPEQLRSTVGELVFEAMCEKGRPTIIVDRTLPETKFYLLGPAGRELIAYGPRLLPVMNCLAINFCTELSTTRLADAGSIAAQSVKVYMMRLRAGFEISARRAGLDFLGYKVFCTVRKDGAFVHVLRARVLFV